MRGRLLGTATGLVLTLLLAAPAAGRTAHTAAGPVAFVLWTGGLARGTSEGVLVHADGTGQRLRSSPAGVVSSVGPFHPKGAKLAAIRAAAHAAMAGPSFVNQVTPGRVAVDGPYVAATFETGGHKDAAIAVGAPAAGLAGLVAAVNGALSPSQRLVQLVRGSGSRAGSRAREHRTVRSGGLLLRGLQERLAEERHQRGADDADKQGRLQRRRRGDRRQVETCPRSRSPPASTSRSHRRPAIPSSCRSSRPPSRSSSAATSSAPDPRPGHPCTSRSTSARAARRRLRV